MTDDDRLAELFRAAASDAAAPTPGFDHDDVVSASRRITARRRSAVIGGAFALFAVVGVGAAVTLPDSSPTASTAAAPAAPDQGARAAAAPEAPVPEGAAGSEGTVRSGGTAGSGGVAADAASPRVAGPASAGFSGPPLGPGDGPCADRQDPQLRAYLEQVLPEVIGAPPAASTDECLPGGQRQVTVEVQDGAARGLFGVSYLPPGTVPKVPVGAVSAPTASGGTVIVHTGPADGTAPPPFLNRLGEVAAFLAPRL